ncbi:MAG: hypothetical protein N5P05_003222 [Chroococcopsis gigantea SAG 12.99]|jgi:hypothetical protein|nr:hypothetical protein [Chlorogloea purpurea SAG 13.99]MDV3001616.1 hypothetical protein [Chroococcopsis gigantea SAG 12.99]
MTHRDQFGDEKLNRIQLILYLMPLCGWILAALTLYGKESSSEQRKVSRISLSLTLSWLIFYVLLWAGSIYGDDTYSFRLLYANGLLTTGYILISLGLMWRLWRGKSINPSAKK